MFCLSKIPLLFKFCIICFIFSLSNGEVFLQEDFTSEAEFENQWVVSKVGVSETDNTSKYQGTWKIEPSLNGLFNGNNILVTSEPSKHYSASRKLTRIFEFDGRQFVFQYEFYIPSSVVCGGAYVKILSDDKSNDELSKIDNESPYTIMFGPDICGSDKKIHFIFRHKNPNTGNFEEKHLKQPEQSKFSHIFTDEKIHNIKLEITSDNKYVVKLDGKDISSGSLLLDFDPSVNPPEFIDDSSDRKPENWVDNPKIPDPNAFKPDDWDEDEPAIIKDQNAQIPDGWKLDSPSLIPDPSDTRPSEWDDQIDGEWTPSMIQNPECSVGCGPWTPPNIPNPKYKGKWIPPLIDNPDYKGIFKPRKIKNPEYFFDPNPYKMTPVSAVAFELWIVNNGIAFDNLLLSDDIDYSNEFSKKIISYRSKAYRIKQVKDIASNKLTVKILTGFFGGIFFIYILYKMFFKKKNPVSDEVREETAIDPAENNISKETTEEVESETSEKGSD